MVRRRFVFAGGVPGGSFWVILAMTLGSAACSERLDVVIPNDVAYVAVLNRNAEEVLGVTGLAPNDAFGFEWDETVDTILIGFAPIPQLLYPELVDDDEVSASVRVANQCEARLPDPDWTYALQTNEALQTLPPLTTDKIVARCEALGKYRAPRNCFPCVYEVTPCPDVEASIRPLEHEPGLPVTHLHGIAWLSSDRVFISAPWRAQVVVTDPAQPRFENPHRPNGLGGLEWVAYDQDQTVYVGSNRGIVAVYDRNGGQLGQLEGFGGLTRVTAGRDGTVIGHGTQGAFELSPDEAMPRSDFPPGLVVVAVDTRDRMAALDDEGRLHVFSQGTWTPSSEIISTAPRMDMVFAPDGVVVTEVGILPQIYRQEDDQWYALPWPVPSAPRAVGTFEGDVVVAGETGSAFIYRTRSTCYLDAIALGNSFINGLDTTPDGRMVYGVTNAFTSVGSLITFQRR